MPSRLVGFALALAATFASTAAVLPAAAATLTAPSPGTPPATVSRRLPASRPSRPRIVSLIPSLTEDLFAIGAGPQVVAVSQATDYPAAAARLPQVASSASLDAERVVRLHPDLVVGIPAQAALVAPLQRVGIRVALLKDDSFSDIFLDLRRLGALSGHADAAAALSSRLRTRTDALTERVRHGARPSAFVVLGVDPIYTVGGHSYIAELLSLAGGTDAARLDAPYARYGAEALVASQPDVIIADNTSGFAAARDHLPWSALRAVRDGRAYVLDDPDILERPGPRYNDGLAWLIARLHPIVRAPAR